MAGEQVFTYADATPVEMAPGITRRTLAETEDMQIVEIQLKAGSEIPHHSHRHHQAEMLTQGEVVMVIDGVEYPCSTGDSWAIPGHVPHSAKIIADSTIVACFSPPREDYQ